MAEKVSKYTDEIVREIILWCKTKKTKKVYGRKFVARQVIFFPDRLRCLLSLSSLPSSLQYLPFGGDYEPPNV